MKFYPKHWGGRSKPADRAVEDLRALGLPYSDKVEGTTRARVRGEFSESEEQQDEEAEYYSVGLVRRSGAVKFDGRTAEEYTGPYAPDQVILGMPLGRGTYGISYIPPWNVFQISCPDPSSAYFGTVTAVPLSVRDHLNDELKVTPTDNSVGIPDLYYWLGTDLPYSKPVLNPPTSAYMIRLHTYSPGGYGPSLTPSVECVIGYWLESADVWGLPLARVRYVRLFADGTADDFWLDAPPGREGHHVDPICIVRLRPNHFIIYAAVFYSPAPGGGSGGEIYAYSSTNNGVSFSVSQVSSLENHLAAAPPGNPTFEPESPPGTAFSSSPTGFLCLRNKALSNIQRSHRAVVMSPTSFLMSLVSYEVVGGEATNTSYIYRTTDAGATFTEVPLPTLLEPGTPDLTPAVEHMVYLGNGRLLAKVRCTLGVASDYPGDPWNLIVSDDFGASWTCIPKVGLPTAAAPDSLNTGHFTVLRRRTATTPGLVLFNIWGGDGYYSYRSRDDGMSWEKAALISPSEECFRMDQGYVHEDKFNYNNVSYLLQDGIRKPISIATPWQYDAAIPYDPMDP